MSTLDYIAANFNECSPWHGLRHGEFLQLSEEQKHLLRHMIARVAEKSFRRGFAQGWDSHERGDKVCDLIRWRFHTSLGVSVSPHGSYTTTAEDRLQCECDTRGLGLGSPSQDGLSPQDIRRWVAPLFPKAFKRESLSRRVRFSILKRDGFRCKYCGASGDEVRLHVDHVVPRVDGGQDTPENLVTACECCNLGKGTTRLD
jgi:5-methylcytosine-specific restriction endonuclease McrA